LEDLSDDIKKAKEDNVLNKESSLPKSLSDADFDVDAIPRDRQREILENQRYLSDTRDRRWLATWTAYVVSIWLGLIILILVLNYWLFHLTDTVLVTLLGTTTLNVLGLTAIVLRGHFGAK
jgi:hypothetical protein